jgi:DNA-binding transcriptional MerR regulator
MKMKKIMSGAVERHHDDGDRTISGADGLTNQVLTSSDVSRIAKISLRQVQWWDERKLISPHQQGNRRIYLPEDVIEIMVVAELRRKGLSLQKIRRVLRLLRQKLLEAGSKRPNSSSSLYLLTDGRSVHLEEQTGRIIDLLKHARQPMSLVCVSDQVKRLVSDKSISRQSGKQQLRLF